MDQNRIFPHNPGKGSGIFKAITKIIGNVASSIAERMSSTGVVINRLAFCSTLGVGVYAVFAGASCDIIQKRLAVIAFRKKFVHAQIVHF